MILVEYDRSVVLVGIEGIITVLADIVDAGHVFNIREEHFVRDGEGIVLDNLGLGYVSLILIEYS